MSEEQKKEEIGRCPDCRTKPGHYHLSVIEGQKCWSPCFRKAYNGEVWHPEYFPGTFDGPVWEEKGVEPKEEGEE